MNIVIHPGDNIVVVATTPAPSAPAPAQLVVRLVVGVEGLRFQGKPTTWDQLGVLLGNLPNRNSTALEVAPETPDLPVERCFDAQGHAGALVNKWGLKYLSQVSPERQHD